MRRFYFSLFFFSVCVQCHVNFCYAAKFIFYGHFANRGNNSTLNVHVNKMFDMENMAGQCRRTFSEAHTLNYIEIRQWQRWCIGNLTMNPLNG